MNMQMDYKCALEVISLSELQWLNTQKRTIWQTEIEVLTTEVEARKRVLVHLFTHNPRGSIEHHTWVDFTHLLLRFIFGRWIRASCFLSCTCAMWVMDEPQSGSHRQGHLPTPILELHSEYIFHVWSIIRAACNINHRQRVTCISWLILSFVWHPQV